MKSPRTCNQILKRLAVSLLAMSFWFVPQWASAQQTPPSSPLAGLKFKAGQEQQNDMRAMKTEMLVARSEKLAIQQLKKLLHKYKHTSIESGLWFRLAELYMRRSNGARFFELTRKSETSVSISPKRVEGATSRDYIKKAIKIYEKIERQFPHYEEMDLVMFNNAFARQTIGEDQSARKIYQALIDRFPDSYLVPDSHLAIGEMEFNARHFERALKHFNAIKNYPNSRVYPYGIYKAAWSYYNLHNAGQALKEMQQVVAYGRTVKEKGIDARLDLRKEALQDMTLFFEDVFPASQAYDYFSEQAGEMDVGPILLRLADLYKRHSRYKDKETLLKNYLDEQPDSSHAPQAYDELVWNYEALRERPQAASELETMYDICKPDSSWVRHQLRQIAASHPASTAKAKPSAQDTPATPADPSATCFEQLRDTSLALAGKWLRMWHKNKTYPMFADVSERAFRVYLQMDDGSEKAAQARFAYAELLFQRQKYRLASSEYEKAGQKTKDKKIGHDARYGALVSLQKAVNDKWNKEDEQRFFVLANDYVKKDPHGPYILDVEFKMGLLHYEKNRYDLAAPIFLRLGREFRHKDKGVKAQDLYLDILNARKDYDGIRAYTKKLMANQITSARHQALQKIYEQAYFVEIQNMESKGDLKQVIAEYKKFARENPHSDLAEKAWWNAIQLHFKVFDDIGGAEACLQFYKLYPKSQNAKGALLKAAQTYESMGQLKKAATVLESLAKEDTKSASKWQIMAADFYRLNGNWPAAKALYSVLKTRPAYEVQALNRLEQMAKTQGHVAEDEKLLREISHTGHQPDASMAQLYFVKKAFAAGHDTQAFKLASDLLRVGHKADNRALATTRFIQAQILEKEFRRQSVKTKADRVALVLSLKTEKLDKAQRAYQAVTRYGEPDLAVAAMHRLAGCYSHFVQALREMPRPEGLAPKDEPAFRAELEQLVVPIEEKGVETLSQALQQAERANLHDGIVAQLKAELDQANQRTTLKPLLPMESPGIALPTIKPAEVAS